MDLAGPLGTPLGLSQWKRASSRVEAGTSVFLSNSDSDRCIPAELGSDSNVWDFSRVLSVKFFSSLTHFPVSLYAL